ncbi:MAG: LysE family transporter, partial [Ignavibacteriaceae bacterium]|nr:LysE family transporter [Ignavibacteriaceae bacterium]
GILKSYFITLFLTLTNPLTIFGFFALFAAFGLDEGLSKFHASGLVIGVFSGSFLWFLSITTGSRFFRNKIELNGLKWVNRIAGVLIFISGIFAVISVI